MSQKQASLTEAQKFLEKGQYDRAVAAFQIALRADPGDLRVLIKLAETQQKLGDNRGASESYLAVAEHHAQSGFWLKAAAAYKRVLALQPRNVEVHLKLAEVYQQLGLTSEAMSFSYAVARILQEHNDNIGYLEVLRRMATLEPANVGIRIKLAEFYSGQNDMDAAIAEFTKAASMLHSSGRLDDYAKVAERLLYHRPEALHELHRLVSVYLDQNDPRRALAKLQQAARLDPQNTNTLGLLVRTFELLGQPDKVTQVLREKARAHQRLNQDEPARQAWQRVLDTHPDDAEAREQLGIPDDAPPPPPSITDEATLQEIDRLLTETDVYIRYNLNDRAFDHLRKVFLMDPNNLDAMERIKEMHAQAGYYPQAVDELLRMAKLASFRDRPRALDYLREAHQLLPDNADTLTLAEQLGFQRHDLFPSLQRASAHELADVLPDADSVDHMLAQLTAEFGDDAPALDGAAPLTHVQEIDMPEAASAADLRSLDPEDLHILEDDDDLVQLDDDEDLAELDIDDLDDIDAVEIANQLRDSLDDAPRNVLEPDEDPSARTEDESEEAAPILDDDDDDLDLLSDLQDGFDLSDAEVDNLSALLSGPSHSIAVGSISMAPPSNPPSHEPLREQPPSAAAPDDDDDDLIALDDDDDDAPSGPPDDEDEDHDDADNVLASFFNNQNAARAANPPINPISREARQDLSQFANHFRHEAATAAYTPTSARGTVTDADMQTLARRTTLAEEMADDEDNATSMIDVAELQRRMVTAAPTAPAPPQPTPVTAQPPAEIPQELADELAEVDFFQKLNLLDDAQAILHELIERWPSHPALLQRMGHPSPTPAPKPTPRLRHAPNPTPHSLAEEPPLPPPPTQHDLPPSPLPDFASDDNSSHFELGLAYREMGLLEDAIAELQRGLQAGLQVPQSQLLIAQCLFEAAAHHEAVAAFKDALRACAHLPDLQAQAWYRLGLLYEQLGQPAEAQYHLQRVQQRHDLFPDLTARLARYR